MLSRDAGAAEPSAALKRPTRIAVIGAGSAGLAMAQQALDVGRDQVQLVVFEREGHVGGLWHYCPTPGPCEVRGATDGSPGLARFADWPDHPALPPSAMYDGLRTNIASDIMAYRDEPFVQGLSLFPARADVEAYLDAFADHYDLRKYIRFNTHVVHVERSQHMWSVTVRDAQGERTEAFDALVCAQGRCSVPYIPSIPHMDRFRGKQLHSAWYRTPTDFRGQRIVVVGSNSSGCDITRELMGGTVREFPVVNEWQRDTLQDPPRTQVEVFQSYHNPDEPPPMDYDPRDPQAPAWCKRIQVVGPITHVDTDGALVLQDGTRLANIDTIVWATGFLYQVPFTTRGEPFVSRPLIPPVGTPGVRVAPEANAASVLENMDDWLLFYEGAPNLVFLGLPNRIVPFPLAQLQSRVAANVFLGKMPPLPRVRSDLPMSDPQRWEPQPANDHHSQPLWRDWTFGASSEIAYHDALLALLPGPQSKERPPGEQQYLEHNDGRGEGVHPPEGWYQFAQWRRDRRIHGKELRRETLGY